MHIVLASDHAGFPLKRVLVLYLQELGHEVEDMGPYTLEPEDDYPDYCMPLARHVATHEGTLGVAIGFSGQGEAIACNRILGARAAVYYGGPEEVLRLSREHNDANILSLGARFLTLEEAKEAVMVWLGVDFSQGERHMRRIKKLDHA